MLNRDEDIITSGQRHPFLATWKVAVNQDGKIQALDTDVYCNGGHTQDLSGAVVERAISHIDNCYKIPNIYVRGRIAKTNTVSNTAFRGFGGPQGMFICERLAFCPYCTRSEVQKNPGDGAVRILLRFLLCDSITRGSLADYLPVASCPKLPTISACLSRNLERSTCKNNRTPPASKTWLCLPDAVE